MPLEDDRALLEGFRRGDRDALAAVYRLHAEGLARFLRNGFSFRSGARICRFRGARPGFDLEDRLHDVFARAFAEPARLGYDGLSPYGPYLRGIARNLVIDQFRRQERALEAFTVEPESLAEEASGASEPMHGAFVPTGDPELDADRRALMQEVERFTGELPPREREVYRLRFVEELEHRDIAARTGLSPAKIKTSEQRIRTRFFRHMRASGYFEGYEESERGWLRWRRPHPRRTT